MLILWHGAWETLAQYHKTIWGVTSSIGSTTKAACATLLHVSTLLGVPLGEDEGIKFLPQRASSWRQRIGQKCANVLLTKIFHGAVYDLPSLGLFWQTVRGPGDAWTLEILGRMGTSPTEWSHETGMLLVVLLQGFWSSGYFLCYTEIISEVKLKFPVHETLRHIC